jgi:hypothetical protein
MIIQGACRAPIEVAVRGVVAGKQSANLTITLRRRFRLVYDIPSLTLEQPDPWLPDTLETGHPLP